MTMSFGRTRNESFRRVEKQWFKERGFEFVFSARRFRRQSFDRSVVEVVTQIRPTENSGLKISEVDWKFPKVDFEEVLGLLPLDGESWWDPETKSGGQSDRFVELEVRPITVLVAQIEFTTGVSLLEVQLDILDSTEEFPDDWIVSFE
jgi:hypothetical protein